MKKISKQEVYKNGNLTVSTYQFEIPNGEQNGKVLHLVELKTIKKRWSDEMNGYYKQSQYITISQDQLNSLIHGIKGM